MASLCSEIVVKTGEQRPCFVNGKKALFHRWSDESYIVAPSYMKGGHGGGTIRETVAVVEYEDGRVDRAALSSVRFVAEDFRAYDWGENEGAGSYEK